MNNNTLIISGLILRKAIKRLDITQEKAAKLLGVSRQTVVTWIGKSELDKETCQIVKDKLGIDLKEFANDYDVPRKIQTINNASLEEDGLTMRLINRLEKELENRDKQIDNLIHDKNKIIEKTEEALELWKEKAREYERQISDIQKK